MPELAPEQANPMKCIEPILLANREAPTYAFELKTEIIISKVRKFPQNEEFREQYCIFYS